MVQDRAHPAGDIAFTGLQKHYESARPDYPDAALDFLQNECANPVPPQIADVGCGTGKLTRQLAGLYPQSRICGCDANADMIDQAGQAADLPNVRYLVSPAETLPFCKGEIGLLTVAQAVQWFDRPTFYDEAARVLSEEGKLVLIENNRDWRTSPFLDRYESLLEDNAPGYSRFYRDHDYASELAKAGFSQVRSQSFCWAREMSVDQFKQMALSSTRMQAAIRAQGDSVMARLGQLLDSPETQNERIEVPYKTDVIIAQR